jgi:hypothetical protein
MEALARLDEAIEKLGEVPAGELKERIEKLVGLYNKLSGIHGDTIWLESSWDD